MPALKAETNLYADIAVDPLGFNRNTGPGKFSIIASYRPRAYDRGHNRWGNIPDAKPVRIRIILSGKTADVIRTLFEEGEFDVGTPIIAMGRANDLPEIRMFDGQPVQTITFYANNLTRDVVKEELLAEASERRRDDAGYDDYEDGPVGYGDGEDRIADLPLDDDED